MKLMLKFLNRKTCRYKHMYIRLKENTAEVVAKVRCGLII